MKKLFTTLAWIIAAPFLILAGAAFILYAGGALAFIIAAVMVLAVSLMPILIGLGLAILILWFILKLAD